MKIPAALVLLGCLLVGAAISAQDEPTLVDTTDIVIDTTEGEVLEQPWDTVRYERVEELDRFRPAADPTDLEQQLSQNPTAALFKSMVVPGWGQLGNGSYIKAVLFFGLDAWMVGSAIHYGRQASDFRERYDAATTVSERNEWYALYDDRRTERNKFTWFAAIVSFIAMFDAYVDAHFSGFPDADRDFSFDLAPDTEGGVKASLTVPF